MTKTEVQEWYLTFVLDPHSADHYYVAGYYSRVSNTVGLSHAARIRTIGRNVYDSDSLADAWTMGWKDADGDFS